MRHFERGIAFRFFHLERKFAVGIGHGGLRASGDGHIGVRQDPLVRLVFYRTADGYILVFIFRNVDSLCRSQIQQEKAEQNVLVSFHISI